MSKVLTDWFQIRQHRQIRKEMDELSKQIQASGKILYRKENQKLVVTIDRFQEGRESTLGAIKVREKVIACTLEDIQRNEKLYAKTAIPVGTYPVTLRKVGGFFARYSKLFGKEHPMLWIRQVPNFTYILIHMGNKHTHSAGCVLVGSNYDYVNGDFVLLDSKSAYLELYQEVAFHLLAGGSVTLKVRNLIKNPKLYTGGYDG